MNNLKTIHQKVEKLLSTNNETRDNDFYLIGLFWYYENAPYFESNPEMKRFLVMLKEGEFSSPDAITRCRRKIQKEKLHLRGKFYKKRLEKAKQIKFTM